jgi:hypothetical protein
VLLSFFRFEKEAARRFAELIMDAHAILKGIGIAVAIIIPLAAPSMSVMAMFQQQPGFGFHQTGLMG